MFLRNIKKDISHDDNDNDDHQQAEKNNNNNSKRSRKNSKKKGGKQLDDFGHTDNAAINHSKSKKKRGRGKGRIGRRSSNVSDSSSSGTISAGGAYCTMIPRNASTRLFDHNDEEEEEDEDSHLNNSTSTTETWISCDSLGYHNHSPILSHPRPQHEHRRRGTGRKREVVVKEDDEYEEEEEEEEKGDDGNDDREKRRQCNRRFQPSPALTSVTDEIVEHGMVMARSRRSLPDTWYYSSNHVMINQERTRRNIAPLTRRSELDGLARIRAEDMAQSGRVDHPADGPLELQIQLGRRPCRRLGENVARGRSIRDIHRSMMKDVLADKNNILDRRYTYFGMGTALGPQGEIYMCQIFKA